MLKLKTYCWNWKLITENTVANKWKNADEKTKHGYCSGAESTIAYKYQSSTLFSFSSLFTPHRTLANACAFREFHAHQRRPTSVRRWWRAQVRNLITTKENSSPMLACTLPSEQGYRIRTGITRLTAIAHLTHSFFPTKLLKLVRLWITQSQRLLDELLFFGYVFMNYTILGVKK